VTRSLQILHFPTLADALETRSESDFPTLSYASECAWNPLRVGLSYTSYTFLHLLRLQQSYSSYTSCGHLWLLHPFVHPEYPHFPGILQFTQFPQILQTHGKKPASPE